MGLVEGLVFGDSFVYGKKTSALGIDTTFECRLTLLDSSVTVIVDWLLTFVFN